MAKRWWRRLFIVYFSCFMVGYYASPSWADTALEETRKLLQKGLTIHEIDREIERLSRKEEQIGELIVLTEQRIEHQNQAVELKRNSAGKVLRSYYMGQRESLFLSLLSMDNLYDMLVALDFMQIVFKHDQRLLLSYKESYEQLKSLKQELLQTQDELHAVKHAFLEERAKLLELQDELETELAFLPEEDALLLREEIRRLTAEWESKGIVLFRKYFSALASAMQELPEIIVANEGHLQMKGSTFIFQITDEQLNDFIRSRNDLFAHLAFHFDNDIITAAGEEDGTSIIIQGYYALVNEPVNKIEFHLQSLHYNGYELPESTGFDLEDQVDLAIYPDKFNPPIEATGVAMEENKLIITLKPKGKWFESLFGKIFSSSN